MTPPSANAVVFADGSHHTNNIQIKRNPLTAGAELNRFFIFFINTLLVPYNDTT